jgi:hypothetical protein
MCKSGKIGDIQENLFTYPVLLVRQGQKKEIDLLPEVEKKDP